MAEHFMKQKLCTTAILKSKYDLWPLLGIIGFGCVMGTAYSIYSIVQKPDVRLNRKNAELPPWEEVNPETPQKLMSFRTQYRKIPEVEQLHREIGPYRFK